LQDVGSQFVYAQRRQTLQHVPSGQSWWAEGAHTFLTINVQPHIVPQPTGSYHWHAIIGRAAARVSKPPRATPNPERFCVFSIFQFFGLKFVLQPSQVDNYPTCDAIVATLPLKYGVCAAVASRIFEKEKRKWNRNHATTA